MRFALDLSAHRYVEGFYAIYAAITLMRLTLFIGRGRRAPEWSKKNFPVKGIKRGALHFKVGGPIEWSAGWFYV